MAGGEGKAAQNSGEEVSPTDLLPQVYEELRRLAAAKLAHERGDHTLDATALVHEVYLKLGGERTFSSRSGFMQAAAQAMRRILVDHARRRKAVKRDGGQRVDLNPNLLAVSPMQDDVLFALDEALERLATMQPRIAELVQLRYFAGASIPEAAAILEIAPRTADAWWAYAKAWLTADLQNS